MEKSDFSGLTLLGDRGRAKPERTPRKIPAFLSYLPFLVLIVLSFFVNLGGPSLWEMDEPYFAEAAREMQASGEWLVPTFNGDLRLQKPIFFYWLIRLSYEVFGVSEFAARVPGALAALVTIFFTYLIGRRLSGRSAGFFSAIVLATSMRFVLMGRLALTDMVMLSLLTMALYFFLRAIDSDELKQGSMFLAMWAAIGLAFLTKGPVSLLLCGLTVILTLLWTKKYEEVKNAQYITGLLLFAAIALPWYIYMTYRFDGTYLRLALVRDNLSRFFTSELGNTRFFLYYVRVLLGDFMPWTPFLLGAVALHAKDALTGKKKEPLSPALKFFSVWAGVVLVFFTLCRFKVPHYILPLYPPCALVVGGYLSRFCGPKRERADLFFTVPAYLTACSLALFGILLYIHLAFVLKEGVGTPAYVPAIILVVGAVLLAALTARKLARAVPAAVFVTISLVVVTFAVFTWEPYEKYRPVREYGRLIRSQWQKGGRVAFYSLLHSGLFFYTEKNVERLMGLEELEGLLASPVRTFCVLESGDYEKLLPKLQKQAKYFVIADRPIYFPRFGTLFGTNPEQAERRLILISNQETAKKEPMKRQPGKQEPAKQEPEKRQPEPARQEPAKQEPARQEPVRPK